MDKEKFKVGIIFDNGKIISKNFLTKKLAEDYILAISDKEKIKRTDILNKETKERERIF